MSLGGADLRHLAAAKTLQKQILELELLSFDKRLMAAAAVLTRNVYSD